MTRRRCSWAGDDPLMIRYHDREWGRPLHDDRALFELLILEGAQAGLSWRTVLHRREGYRRAFAGFDPRAVAAFTAADRNRILRDPGIVRNRLKVRSAVANARAFLAVQKEFRSFDRYVWSFVGGAPIEHRIRSKSDIPVTSPESDALSADLKRRGFSFVGSTICYAYLQAAGLVNDHLMTCPSRRPRGRRS